MWIRLLAAMVVVLATPAPVAAQTPPAGAGGYPSRPVRFILPLPPGGSPDTIARTIAAEIHWPHPIVVENRTAGGRILAADLVAKSAPDGHTWFLTTDNIMAVIPHLGKTPYDPLRDFTPVTQTARFQFLLVVHPSVPAKSVQELVALAKAKPGVLNYASSGNGSAQHLGTAMLQYLTGIEMTHVPYKGAGPALADLLPGRTQVFLGAANQLLPQVKEGRLRLLAQASAQRSPLLPDVPTIAESGVPGYRHDVWSAVLMPAKVPPAIVAKASADIARVLNAPETRARLAAQGIDVVTGSSQSLGQLIREDYERWGKVVRATGIKAE
ncbi:MAG: Bug family tripartite tricarboxylate transporter substrate binding protein [Burkholderiales bacterium]